MKKQTITVILSLSIITNLLGQDIKSDFDTFQSKMSDYWETKNFQEAIDDMLPIYNQYEKLDEDQKNQYRWIARYISYNMACAYSLLKENKNSLKFLGLSYQYGWKDYHHITIDSDLDNIRNEPDFKILLTKFKEVGDYKFILQSACEYSDTILTSPIFTYQDSSELRELRIKYNLDSVAGSGDEFSRIVNLMSWVNHIVRHDGMYYYNGPYDACSIISFSQEENKGVNCRMMATILNEVYLAMGLKSRFVTCMPKGEEFEDCHVINEVYSKQYKKWLWMDPSFETYIMDKNNIPLSIQEVRKNLCNEVPMKVSEKIHWNEKPYSGGGEKYLYQYMIKNLYRFSFPLHSMSAYESSDIKRTYVELYPLGYNEKNIALNKNIDSDNKNTYFITNDSMIWSSPCK